MLQKTEEFLDFIDKIRASNIMVIVEGKKDKIALEKLGINNIVELSKKPIFQIVEEIADSNDECIILTDLDKEGKQLYSKLNSNLQKHGVKVNNRFREFLFKNTKLRQIEGIVSYLDSF
ncbi:toprim domain-containing protein [Candidatus Woesearchaeota archaeon]|nr:toprim domain-containing protein [Candidatus Woesearchaeota archaeon]